MNNTVQEFQNIENKYREIVERLVSQAIKPSVEDFRESTKLELKESAQMITDTSSKMAAKFLSIENQIKGKMEDMENSFDSGLLNFLQELSKISSDVSSKIVESQQILTTQNKSLSERVDDLGKESKNHLTASNQQLQLSGKHLSDLIGKTHSQTNESLKQIFTKLSENVKEETALITSGQKSALQKIENKYDELYKRFNLILIIVISCAGFISLLFVILVFLILFK